MFTMSTQHRRCRSITSLMNARQAVNRQGAGSNLAGMTVLSIMISAYQVRWEALEGRIRSHPIEAKQLDEHGRTVLYKALSRRMDDYPSPQTIQYLVDANQAAVWEGIVDLYEDDASITNNNSNNNAAARAAAGLHPPRQGAHFTNSPIIVAAWRRASLEILQCLVDARPAIPSQDMAAIVSLWSSYRDLYGSEEALQEILREGGREGFAVFSKMFCLVKYCSTPEVALVEPWANGSSLHRATGAVDCSVYLFQEILQKFPEQMRQQQEGRFPLHNLMLLKTNNSHDKEAAWREEQSRYERMKVLLQMYPEAVRELDQHGQLPLHLAIISGWHHLHLMELVEMYPQSTSQRDGESLLYPFQLAATHDLSLTSIFKLLLAAPSLLEAQIPSLPNKETPKHSQQAPFSLDDTDINNKKSNLASTEFSLGNSQNGSNVVSDELKTLLQYVRNKHDDRLWMDLQSLLKPCTQQGAPDDEWIALHAAVSLTECPFGLIKVMIFIHREQLLQQDSKGRTPLHCAAANAAKSLLATLPPVDDNTDAEANGDNGGENNTNNNDNTGNGDNNATEAPARRQEADLRTLRLQAVLEAHPASARVRDRDGRLPLHLAAYHGMPAASLEPLIQAWPDALYQRDGQLSLYPFLLAGCSPVATLNDVFWLLSRAPHVLTTACGLVD